MVLEISTELEQEITRLWGKPLAELTDEEAKEIVENYTDIAIKDACFMTDNEIYYTEEEQEESEIAPSWSEQYLNTLGMSLADF